MSGRKFREEYEKYIHSAAWKKKAMQRMEQDHHICKVCGKEAQEVHHLTYEHFKDEPMEDLVSLCTECHRKAEAFYDQDSFPWAMETENHFMAAMRVDAVNLAPQVFAYIKTVRGMDFDDLMTLRQPSGGKKYWGALEDAVQALCCKRYSRNCVADRTDMMLGAITNRVKAICLAQIEHSIRNAVQAELHEKTMAIYDKLGKWKDVSAALGITVGTLQTLRRDDGSSFGPTLREAVYYYCSLDAASGIAPLEGFDCLTEADYRMLKDMAAYALEISKEENDYA